jgi:molybdopterin-containing oxidoreductase family membrane subunit
MGLIIPGFIPSTLGEIIEYRPTLREWQVTAGIWAFGFGVLTVLLRITGHVFTRGRSSFPPPASSAPPEDPLADGAPT